MIFFFFVVVCEHSNPSQNKPILKTQGSQGAPPCGIKKATILCLYTVRIKRKIISNPPGTLVPFSFTLSVNYSTSLFFTCKRKLLLNYSSRIAFGKANYLLREDLLQKKKKEKQLKKTIKMS